MKLLILTLILFANSINAKPINGSSGEKQVEQTNMDPLPTIDFSLCGDRNSSELRYLWNDLSNFSPLAVQEFKPVYDKFISLIEKGVHRVSESIKVR